MWSPDDHPELLNEELQTAISAITASDTPENRKRLYEVLLTLTYCVCQTTDDTDGSTTVSATLNENGELVLIAFSDPAALRRWDADTESFLMMAAEPFFTMARDSNFAAISLNPAGPAGGIIRRHEFVPLAEGRIPDVAATHPAPKDTTANGEASYPSDLILMYKRRNMLPMLSVILVLLVFLVLFYPHLLQKEQLRFMDYAVLYGGPVAGLILLPVLLGLICSVVLPRPAVHLTSEGIAVTNIFYVTKKEPWANITRMKFEMVEASNGSKHRMLHVYKTGDKLINYVHVDFLHGSPEVNQHAVEAYFAGIRATG